MKRILLILCCFALLIFMPGCENKTTDSTKQEVSINLPLDNSVNGYRESESINTPNKLSPEELDKVVEELLNGENSKVTSNESMPDDTASSHVTDSVSSSYCGNKNSKIFHAGNCGSVKNMTESNKVYFSTRDEFIKNGYTPCKRCNP